MFSVHKIDQNEPGRRTGVSSFITSIEARTRMGMTEEDVHNLWIRPQLEASARDMGVEFKVSDLGADGTITCEVI